MSSGIKASANRPKSSKHLRASSKKKRYRNTTEAQSAYHKKIALRRDKSKKRRARKAR